MEVKQIKEEVKGRWSAELNEFWATVLGLSLKIGGSAFGILAMDFALKTAFGISLKDLGIPEMIFTICGYILTACGAMGLAAKLTK